ncbi:hypothetical protein ACFLQ2_00075 [archaeon]
MRNVLIVLAVLLLAGCAGTSEEATPTPAATPVATPVVTPEPTATPTPEPTPMPAGHDCYVDYDHELSDAIRIQECFMEAGDHVECVYFMLKGAREAEKTGETLQAGWAMRLYSKAIICAKEAEQHENAALLPENMANTINDYFMCYHADAVCGATTDDVDEILVELEEVRQDFA